METTSAMPAQVVVREVGLRDGLQSLNQILPTEQKKTWISEAYSLGQREIEVGSFVPAKYLPQLADTAELVSFAKKLPGLHVSVLIPNIRGAEDAMGTQADLMLVPLSASKAHSLANLKKTPDEMLADVAKICRIRDSTSSKILIEGGVGTAFGCTLQGNVAQSDVIRLMQALLDAGVDKVSLADTVGYADPSATARLFEKARRVAGDRMWSGHFHDTRGLALANIYAAMQTGVTRFDSSLGGIGGCPHAPGASGNVSTEDLVYMLWSMNIDTGIDIKKLLDLRQNIVNLLDDKEQAHSSIIRAGLPHLS